MLIPRYQHKPTAMEKLYISKKVLELLTELSLPGELVEETLERIWQLQSE